MEGFFYLAFSLYKPLSLHAAPAVVLLLMYAQGSFVSKYTLHGLSNRIFLHYYGDLNCLLDASCFFVPKVNMMQLGMHYMIGVGNEIQRMEDV